MYIEYFQLKSSRDTTCLKPGNFRCITSFATYNISIKRKDLDLSNAIILASITGLVVELQQIKKGTSKIATPINRFSDCNNISRKQYPESGFPLTETRDQELFKSVLFVSNRRRIVAIRCFENSSLFSIPEVIPQDEN
jgi:hypothetical protein